MAGSRHLNAVWQATTRDNNLAQDISPRVWLYYSSIHLKTSFESTNVKPLSENYGGLDIHLTIPKLPPYINESDRDRTDRT